MNITVKTLLDITETKKHKHNCTEKQLVLQQANFMSFFNCLSMRFNPYYDEGPVVETVDVTDLGFGSDYKGKQKVWTFNFSIETAVAEFNKAMIIEDLDLIPMVGNLTETIKINNNVFKTTDPEQCNIIFILPDNAE